MHGGPTTIQSTKKKKKSLPFKNMSQDQKHFLNH